MKELTFFLKK